MVKRSAVVVLVVAGAVPGLQAADFPVWPSGCSRFEGSERAACLLSIANDYGTLAREMRRASSCQHLRH